MSELLDLTTLLQADEKVLFSNNERAYCVEVRIIKLLPNGNKLTTSKSISYMDAGLQNNFEFAVRQEIKGMLNELRK